MEATAMQVLIDFLKTWGPWIIGALLPTLIVGLSKSPKTRGVADVLKYILQFLSVATPKDAPGTFKLPLTAPAKLPPKTDGGVSRLGPPAAVVLIVFLLGKLLFVSVGSGAVAGCSWLANIGKGSEAGVINCASETLMANAGNLFATVKAILTGGAVNWKEQLDALKNMGEDALACALYQVGDELQKQSAPPPGVSDSPEKAKMRATYAQGSRKAQTYLQERKLKPTMPSKAE
jgi:hypothetical protein